MINYEPVFWASVSNWGHDFNNFRIFTIYISFNVNIGSFSAAVLEKIKKTHTLFHCFTIISLFKREILFILIIYISFSIMILCTKVG